MNSTCLSASLISIWFESPTLDRSSGTGLGETFERVLFYIIKEFKSFESRNEEIGYSA